MGMATCVESQVGERIAGDAVGAGLKQNELGPGVADEGFDPIPGLTELAFTRAGRIGKLSLVPLACPSPVSSTRPVPG